MQELPDDPLARQVASVLAAIGARCTDSSQAGHERVFTCRGPGPQEWTLWVTPRLDEDAAFAEGASFRLGYRGAPPNAALNALRGLAARLRALERTTGSDAWFAASESAARLNEPSLIYGQTRLEMRVTLRCNERCIFCNSSEIAENMVGSRAEALALLPRAQEHGAELLVLTGGEPLLVPWVADVAVQARELGYRRVTLQTNGVLLAREDVLQRLHKVAPDEILISVHGPDDAVIESVSGLPGLLEPKQQAIVACVQAGYRVVISYVLCRQNMEHATAAMEMLASLPAKPQMVAFSFVAPAGSAINLGRQTIPSMTEATPHLLAGLRRADALGMDAVLVEYCVLPTCIEPALRPFCEPFDPDNPLGVPPDKTKLSVCDDCYWTERCSGMFKGYLNLYGPDEILQAPAAHRKA